MSENSIAGRPLIFQTQDGICVATPTKNGVVIANENSGVCQVSNEDFKKFLTGNFNNKPEYDTVSLGGKQDWTCNAPPREPEKKKSHLLQNLVMFTAGAVLTYWQRGNIAKGLSNAAKYLTDKGITLDKFKPNKENWNRVVDTVSGWLGKLKTAKA